MRNRLASARPVRCAIYTRRSVAKAPDRYPDELPANVRQQLEHELQLIADLA